jgi:hypothetical protein
VQIHVIKLNGQTKYFERKEREKEKRTEKNEKSWEYFID